MSKSKKHSMDQDQSKVEVMSQEQSQSMSKSKEHCMDQSSQPEQQSMDQVNISDLPREMLFPIFQLLPPRDLKSAVLVCKTWLEIGEDSKLWTWVVVTLDTEQDFVKLNIQRLQLLQEIEVTYGRHYGYYAHLVNKEQCYWMNGGMSKLFRVINEIPTIRRIRGLEYYYLLISDVEPVLFVSVLNRLEELRLSRCPQTGCYQILLTPEQLELLFTAIAEKTNLEFLELGGQEHLSKIDPELFAAALSNVVKVRLEESYVGDITTQQLMALFKAIIADDRPLKKLEVSADPRPSIDPELMGSALNKLEDVTISYFFDSREEITAIIRNLVADQITAIIRNLVDGESRLKSLMLAVIYPDIIEGLNQDLVRRARIKMGDFYSIDEELN